MFKLILCTLAVAYVSAAPVSADNIGVNKATVLGDGEVAGLVGRPQCIKEGYDCDETYECCAPLTCTARTGKLGDNGCYDDRIPDIAKTLTNIPMFSQFVIALKAGKLMTTLASNSTPCPSCPAHGDHPSAGPFTVFAPSDEAFAALPNATLAHLLDPKNIKELQAVLEYHMVFGPSICFPATDAACYGWGSSGAAIAADLKSSQKNQTAKTLEGQDVSIERRDGSIFVENSKVAVYNVAARNGVMHVIDHVLIPPKPLASTEALII